MIQLGIVLRLFAVVEKFVVLSVFSTVYFCGLQMLTATGGILGALAALTAESAQSAGKLLLLRFRAGCRDGWLS
jgi:hypothetical protein